MKTINYTSVSINEVEQKACHFEMANTPRNHYIKKSNNSKKSFTVMSLIKLTAVVFVAVVLQAYFK